MRLLAALLAALLLAPLALTGQAVGVSIPNQPPAAPAPQYRPEDLCSVEGRVVNSETGVPVNKVSLLLSSTTGRGGGSAVSDASGKFAFPNVAPGTYRILFNRPGYQSVHSTMSDFPTISLERGQRRTDMVLRATPLGTVAGRLVDEDGDPIVNAQIQLCRFQYVQGRKQLAPAGSAATNDLGEYRLFDAAPGKYLISATYTRALRISTRPDGGIGLAQAVYPFDPGGDEDYVTTFYPGTADPATAVRIEIAPGAQVQNINFRLSKTRTVRVRGRIASLAPSDRQTVALMPRNNLGMNSQRSSAVDRTGNFELANVPPGSYVLTAVVSPTGKPPYLLHQFLEVGTSNVEGVVVSIQPLAEVRGRIRVEGQDSPAPRNLRISLSLRDGGPGGLSVRVNDDGSFLLENVSPDRYNVGLAGLPNGYYLKAVRVGGADALVSGLDIAGGPPGPVEIVVSPGAGQIAGVVQNQQLSQPAGGAIVALIPQEKERRERDTFYQTATSDPAGRFTLRNISPGEYKVFAWEQIEEGGAYMDPEFMKPFEDKGQAVTIREGDKPEIQLNVIPR